MAVDGVEEDDAPGRPPARPGEWPGRAGQAAELDRRAIERRLHGSWSTTPTARHATRGGEAAPHLRSAWENHRARYPERELASPGTTSDGGWVAGEHRRLAPEQNAKASGACADLADEGRRDTLPALKRVESANPDRRPAGLGHMLKGEGRLKVKIAERLEAKPGRTVQWLNRIKEGAASAG